MNKKALDNRGKGRARVRCKEQFEEDLKQMGIRGWMEVAKDRKKWRKIVEHALGQ